MENEWISKKELMAHTGISYGQLYRWKRENLIPEDWFVRKSTFTGQETFFPKDKILERIRSIMGLKDRYPLEDVARMLSPELTGISFRIAKVIRDELVDKETAALLQEQQGKEFCTFFEICILKALGEARVADVLSQNDLERILGSVADWNKQYTGGSYMLYVLSLGNAHTVILGAKEPPVLLDHELKVAGRYDLEAIGAELKRKLSALAIDNE